MRLRYIVTDEAGNVLWVGEAPSPEAAARAARGAPMPTNDELPPLPLPRDLHVRLGEINRKRYGDRAMRMAITTGTYMGQY